MSISSRDNILLLQNLLKDHPLLQSRPQEFQYVFNKELERMHDNRFHYKSNLMVMNKEILKTFNRIKTDMLHPDSSKIGSLEQKYIQAPSDSRTFKSFEASLDERQNDFKQLMSKSTPKEIDFTDKAEDTPFTQNDYENNMSQREAELSKIMMSQRKNKKVEAWLKGDSNVKPDNINLQIDRGSNVELKPISITKTPLFTNEKHVTFKDEVEETVAPNFFSKLKIKNDNENSDDFKSLFKTMIDNQKIIIEQLKLMSEHLAPKNEEPEPIKP